MKRKRISILFIAILLCSVFYIFINNTNSNALQPAEKGEMDLSQWDFEKDGVISLDGEWEYYEGQLLEPEDFTGTGKQKPELTGYARLTSSRRLFTKEKLPKARGIRTYRLLITTHSSSQLLGLRIDNIKMSNKLYVNGRLQGASGNPAPKGQGYQPKNAAYSAFFNSEGEQLEILLQMANYDYPLKGYMYTIVLGSQKDINLNQIIHSAIELGFSVLSLFFALFYFFLYRIGNREKIMLPSITQFLFLAIVLLFSGVKLIYALIPNLSFELFCKVQMISLTGIVGSIISYTNLTSKRIFSDKIAKKLLIIYSIYSLFVLIMPYAVYSYLNPAVLSSYLSIYIYILWNLIRFYRKVSPNLTLRKHIVLYFICLASLMITMANHFLFVLNLASNRAIGSFSFAIFALLSQFFLAYRFVLNYNTMIQMGEVKDEFITKTSYALKAPLGSIINMSESLMEKGDQKEISLKEDTWEAAVIKNTAQNLLDIVNATLDVTLLKNDQLKLMKAGVDLKICAELVAETCEGLVKNRSIQIRLEIPPGLMVEADESRIRQILRNLIHNAIQSMEQGIIIVRGEQNGGQVSIWVEDTGCGIPEEKKELIFEPYIALRSQGIGLGLYLARQLAELMGGTIALEWSRINEGSSFIFSLPAYTGKAELSHIDPVTKKPSVKEIDHDLSHYEEREEYNHTILVADDEVFNTQTVSYVLNKEGYRILTAFSGEEAIRIINDGNVDLVILDILMPGKSGITTCKEIREQYSLIELPVLISTVGNKNDDLVLALKAGANDFISKPFEEKEVVSRVRTLIALKSSMEEALKSEFAFLQAQIKPHFLYNAINTMVSLCYTDGERAAELLTNFSKYLRLIFDVEYKLMAIPLKREIETIRAYVEIEKARFGKLVNVEYNIAPEVLPIEVPPLCIQPLVENAIKHGLCKKSEGGTVYVSVKLEKGLLVIEVKDTGVGMPPEKAELLENMESRSEGVGFFNVSKRVRGWKQARLHINSVEGIGTTVTITAEMNR